MFTLIFTHEILLSSEDAEMEYLKIAQDLEMYGISYFPIKVRLCFRLLVAAQTDKSLVSVVCFQTVEGRNNIIIL
jgi:hypothetical protein